MNTDKIISISSRGFILFSAFSFSSVSLMAFLDPQSVMDLVQVKLSNTDAYSSIRGVYGGVGAAIVVSLIYLTIKDPKKGLEFLALLWGFYALSRTITIFSEGALGAFGTQWLIIETFLFAVACILLVFQRKTHLVAKSVLQ